ncbi:hypothetical protein [Lysinibacillus fusiformis]|uniref:Uncharacterized protein n=1 Tax=Lysinibacillus fusiformis TaxID=28031 RepID=A0A1E4R9V6_9BACI|nr:hypothetical protein [Lysinibacillus fusiformis]ODV57255.1 hypothetical protein BG258_15730 [Lysinibacillus fusiformis]
MDKNDFKLNTDVIKNISELAKEIVRNTNGVKITENDTISTSEYMGSLGETLINVNKEILESDSLEEKSRLHKQREDILNRMREEKENQCTYQANREEKERKHIKAIFGFVCAVSLGAGSVVLKTLLEDKKS